MKDILFYVTTMAFCFFIFIPTVKSDNTTDWDSVLEYLICDDDLSAESSEYLFDLLEELHSTPLNVNTASVAEFSRLPFLSESQIEEIHAYIYFNGPLLSLGELQLVNGLDYKTRNLLRYFVYAGETETVKRKSTVHDVLEYGRQELMVKADIPLYRRSGFKFHSSEELQRYPNRKYYGYPVAHSIRYSFKWHDKIRFGFTADQDAGEPFFGSNKYGYDFYSLYFMYSGDGHLKKLAIGNLKASFGQGLVLSSGFSMGKSMSINSIDRAQNSIKPHSSTSETGFFRGIGLTYGIGKSDISLMISNTPIDVTLDTEKRISSFKTDGYHRTLLEISKKNNVNEKIAAINYSYCNNAVKIGTTGLIEVLDVEMGESKFEYQMNRHTGTSLYGVGIDYSVGRPKMRVAGETAFSKGGAMSMIHSVNLKFLRRYDVRLIYRNYSYKYQSLHASGFAEGSVSNEEGLYLGVNRSFNRINASGYFDLFRFPQIRYGASEPSNGFDTKLQLNRKFMKSDVLDLSVKYKSKQRDCKPTCRLEYENTLRSKLKWKHVFNSFWNMNSQLDFAYKSFPGQHDECGFALSESVSYNNAEKMKFSFTISGFKTDSYDSSISVYEAGLRYSFNFNSLYGDGIRWSVLGRYNVTDRLILSAKFASTCYFDREEIGSSQQQIDSSHKEDMYIQLLYKY